MNLGKISEPTLKRSVLKLIKSDRDYLVQGADIGMDCALFKLEDTELAMATASVSDEKSDEAAAHGIYRATNNLAAGGVTPLAVQLHIMLPARTREIALKRMMEAATAATKETGVVISGGHTEVLEDLTKPIISVTAFGKKISNCILQAEQETNCHNMKQEENTGAFSCQAQQEDSRADCLNGCRPGQDIVMTKWIGISATALLATEREEALLTRYPAYFVKSAQQLSKYYSVLPEAKLALGENITAMHDVAGGGIYGALWELGERYQVGLEVTLKKIPLKQETVEVCEFFDINPYEVRSDGALLMVTDHGEQLAEKLLAAGINACVIGGTTASNDKVIINDEERRFLEPPRKEQVLSNFLK